jgi:hypothetical protein
MYLTFIRSHNSLPYAKFQALQLASAHTSPFPQNLKTNQMSTQRRLLTPPEAGNSYPEYARPISVQEILIAGMNSAPKVVDAEMSRGTHSGGGEREKEESWWMGDGDEAMRG